MDFGGDQSGGIFFRFYHHPITHLWRTFRSAKILGFVVGFIRESYRNRLAFGRFNLDVDRVDGGHDAKDMLAAAMGGNPGPGVQMNINSHQNVAKEYHDGSPFVVASSVLMGSGRGAASSP